MESEGDWFKIAVKDQQTAYVANWVVSKNNSQGTTSQNNTSQVAERKQGTLKGLTIVPMPVMAVMTVVLPAFVEPTKKILILLQQKCSVPNYRLPVQMLS